MAKKILAVVLAVMMAVSAMAVTAFAAEIPLKISNFAATSYSNDLSASLTVPIATLYGFATEGDYIQFTLPTNFTDGGWDRFGGRQINYSIIVNGVEIKLQPCVPTTYKADTNGRIVDAAGKIIKQDTSKDTGTGDYQWYLADAAGNYVDASSNALVKGTDGNWYYNQASVIPGASGNYTPSARVSSSPVVVHKGTKDTVNAEVYTQPVYFGTFYHDYLGEINGATYYATIPQATSFNQYTTLTLVMHADSNVYVEKDANGNIVASAMGDAVYNGQYDYTWRMAQAIAQITDVTKRGTAVRADYYKADNTWVQNSTSFGYTWTIQDQSTGNSSANAMNFTTAEWTVGGVQTSGANVLTWDHTLDNRYAVRTAESAEVVVTLNTPIVGAAVYTLYAKTDAASSYDSGLNNSLWWQYSNKRVAVSTISVDSAVTGPVTELHFPIENLDVLYDSSLYGTFNAEFVIFETPTLWNAKIMSGTNYLKVDRTMVGDDAGSYGPFSWPAKGNDALSYNGSVINYTPVTGGTVRATKVTLVTTEAAAAPVDTPTQGTENTEDSADEGADNFDAAEETTTTPADTNPTTGVALAVVPMLLAAAAAVVSKKH